MDRQVLTSERGADCNRTTDAARSAGYHDDLARQRQKLPLGEPAAAGSTGRRNTCQVRLLTVQSGLSQIHLPSPSSLDTPLNERRVI
jgi:hypothetical protein